MTTFSALDAFVQHEGVLRDACPSQHLHHYVTPRSKRATRTPVDAGNHDIRQNTERFPLHLPFLLVYAHATAHCHTPRHPPTPPPTTPISHLHARTLLQAYPFAIDSNRTPPAHHRHRDATHRAIPTVRTAFSIFVLSLRRFCALPTTMLGSVSRCFACINAPVLGSYLTPPHFRICAVHRA